MSNDRHKCLNTYNDGIAIATEADAPGPEIKQRTLASHSPESTKREEERDSNLREPENETLVDTIESRQTNQERQPSSPASTNTPLRFRPLVQDKTLYLEAPALAQPLIELSPTPMTFPPETLTSNNYTDNAADATEAASSHTPRQSPISSPPYWLAQPLQHPPGNYDGGGLPLHRRPESWTSTDSFTFVGITLCDNEVDARNAACWAKSVAIRSYTIVNGSSTIPSLFRPTLALVAATSRPASRSDGGIVHVNPTPQLSSERYHHQINNAYGSIEGGSNSCEVIEEGQWGNVRATLGMGGIGAFVVFNVVIETLDGGTIEIKRRYSEFDALRRRLVQTFPRFEKAMPELPPKSVVSRFRPKFLEHRRKGLEYFLSCVLLNPEFAGSPVTKEFIFT